MYQLIFKNDLFIVIDKNAGVNFHKEGENDSLFEMLKRDLAVEQLFPVHRLDKMTSGILIIARAADVAAAFTQLFTQRHIEKYYLALSDIKPKKKQGTVSGDMERSRRKSWKLLRTKENPATTKFKSTALTGNLRLFLCKPLSGKTHQIRVALKSIGSPIAGDPIYSKNSEQYDRGYLHAYKISFELYGESYVFESLPRQGCHFTMLDIQKGIETLLPF